MNDNYNKKLVPNSRILRKNMTKEERHLWYDFLKDFPVTFKRQKIIGNYIVDFYCASAKLVIELDGSQHYEEKGQESDYIRDKFLFENGFLVLRYSNLDINRKFSSVCQDIYNNVTLRTEIKTTC
jgi:very-short-patch-repair endonuclease